MKIRALRGKQTRDLDDNLITLTPGEVYDLPGERVTELLRSKAAEIVESGPIEVICLKNDKELGLLYGKVLKLHPHVVQDFCSRGLVQITQDPINRPKFRTVKLKLLRSCTGRDVSGQVVSFEQGRTYDVPTVPFVGRWEGYENTATVLIQIGRAVFHESIKKVKMVVSDGEPEGKIVDVNEAMKLIKRGAGKVVEGFGVEDVTDKK